ncbi:MAG: hypothetical protein KAS17_08635 [Victivallaceae bacterium]|nr:hypothetical protein [Victivallaceae bacterium]
MTTCDDTPLPAATLVLRMCKSTYLKEEINNVQAIFNLSSADKKSDVPHLSVFELESTTIEQAKLLTNKDLEIKLSVDEIRKVGIEQHRLDVLWFTAFNDDGSLDLRDGAIGHCGITGLFCLKGKFKIIRLCLADMAREYWRKQNYL